MPGDVAQVLMWLASDATEFVNGQDLAVDAVSPPTARRRCQPPTASLWRIFPGPSVDDPSVAAAASGKLADWRGLEPILVSKLTCALEGPDLIERTRHPSDPADPRSANHTRSDPIPAPATLTGQDVGEAEGALTALLNHVLSNTDVTRTQYITLRVLALRGPAPSPAELHDYLAGQPQLALDRSQIAELLHGLEAKGLVAGSAADGPGPTQLTAEGAALHARLAEAVGAVTRRVYAGLDPDDLATTHRVLVEVTERARRLRDQP